MIITLIAVTLTIIGIILAIIGWDTDNYCCIIPSAIFTTVGSIVLIIALICIVKVNINKDIDYEQKLYEKTTIEYRIENKDSLGVGNELLYDDIIYFNNSLRSTKKWANNPWTSWFFNEDIATIDYIEIN